MKAKKLLTLITLLLLFSIRAFAQGEGNFWFFGSHAGMDFNSGSPIALTTGALDTEEGCASISNGAGNLLFYTDGVTVYNKLHTMMPNGDSLLGNTSSTQSGIIVPKPGSHTIYYVFTTTLQGLPDGLRYSEVDMTLDSGLGDVTTTKNILLSTPVTEKLTAVKKSNNIDFWVIAHANNTDEFLVYSVTAAGVDTIPVVSACGTLDTSGEGIGYLKSSTNGSKLVAAVYELSVLDVLNFNNTTGIVTFDFSIPFPLAYGVEFSPNGSRLYVASVFYLDLYQYDMTLGSSAAIIASGIIVGSNSLTGFGALQNAPDKKMYVNRYGDTIGCIKHPDSLGLACGYIRDALYLSGYQELGLPNFIVSFFSSSFSYVNTCVGDTTFFSLVDSIPVDSIHWNFGDPVSGINNISNMYAPYHVFSDTGRYTVSSIAYSGSVSDTSRAFVFIIGAPVIFIGNDTAICAHDSITINAGSGYTYLWQDGSTHQTFRAAAGGTYYVKATGRCGVGGDTITIAAIPLPVVIVNDTTICKGQTAHLNAHGATTYTWSAGVASITDSTVTAAPTITTSYYVTGTTGTCSAKDTATVTINPLPVITVNSPTICIGDSATLNAGGALSYVWSTSKTTAGIEVMPTATTSYTVTGTSAAGCVDSAIAIVTITPLPVASTSGDVTIIAGSTTTLSASGGTGYTWTPSTDLSCTTCATPVADPIYTTIYCVEVTNGLCTDTACLTITVQMPCPDVTELQLPDAFSPNNDGNNDLFMLQGWYGCVKEFSITIYDRWGEKVFESADVNFRWDGTYKNKVLDPAVFVYYIKAQLMDGTSIERKGNITLIR